MDKDKEQILETTEPAITPHVEQTDEQKIEKIEETLLNEGTLVPSSDLLHYMVRNASYMQLINSDQFKESGINLEEVLDDEFLNSEFVKNQKTIDLMRYITLSIAPKLAEHAEAEPIVEPEL